MLETCITLAMPNNKIGFYVGIPLNTTLIEVLRIPKTKSKFVHNYFTLGYLTKANGNPILSIWKKKR